MRLRSKRRAVRRLILWGTLTALLLLWAVLAPHMTPNDPYLVDLTIARRPPSAAYPMGTDSLGRCLLSRIMAGAPATLFYSLLVVAITFLTGTLIGVLCGYFGGALDAVVMGLVDILLAFPGIILCIAVAGFLGSGMRNAVIALSVTGWTQYARLARGRVQSLRRDVFLQAAAFTGAPPWKLILRHVLPNTVPSLIVTASLSVGGTIMEMAALSFLGLGAQTPMAEWGVLINEGRSLIQTNPNLSLFPGLFIFLAVVLFNLLGDSLRDVLDPRD